MLDGVFKLEEGTAKDLSSDWVEKFVSTQADFIRATSQAYLGAFKDRLKYSRCPSTAPDVRRSGRLRKTPPGKRACPSGARHAAVTQYSLGPWRGGAVARRALPGTLRRSARCTWRWALGTGWDGAEDAEPILARHREGRENPSTTGKPVQFAVRQRPIEFGVGERGTDVEETASNRKTSCPPSSGRPYHPRHAWTWPHWSARYRACRFRVLRRAHRRPRGVP